MDLYQQIASNNRQTIFILVFFAAAVLGISFVAMEIAKVAPENFPTISVVLFGFLFLWTLISYFYGDKMILSFVGAKPIERKDFFDLYNIVENLSITAGLPNPKIYIIEDESLNAFATGRDPEHSVVCVTRGLLKKLDKRELEGVLAHEMSHIANYDVRLELILITVIGAISMVGEVMMRMRGGNEKKGGSIAFAGLFVYVVGYFVLHLVQLAISRNREYLADATGALYLRDPLPLASALEKIALDPRIESADTMSSAAQLFIADPRSEGIKKGISGKSIFALFSTHPPTEERIKRLRGHS